jgi:type II secretory pathway pseudopilin PulG
VILEVMCSVNTELPSKPNEIPVDKGKLKFIFNCRVVFYTIIVILSVLMYMGLTGLSGNTLAKNSACMTTINNLGRAIEAYRQDFGTYPSVENRPLVADTRVFVKCLGSKRKDDRTRFYLFRDEDLFDGEYISVFSKPFYYTYPAEGVSGPDGKVHPGLKYYLWTSGGASKTLEASWQFNNWSK